MLTPEQAIVELYRLAQETDRIGYSCNALTPGECRRIETIREQLKSIAEDIKSRQE